MNAWLNYVGCGFVALSVLACGSKGSDEDDDTETGGTSSGGTSSGGTSSGGTSTGGTSTGGTGGTGTALPVMTTMDFSAATDVCPIPTGVNMAGCWKLVDSNADLTTAAPLPAADITFQHTTADGDPDDGAFEATIPYSEESQWVSFGINFDAADLSNRVISVRVKIAEGMTVPGGSKVYAKSGMGYCYANGDYANHGDAAHPLGEWSTIQFNLLRPPAYRDPNCAEPFNPADIREIGVQFDSSPMAMDAETAVVLVDTVTF